MISLIEALNYRSLQFIRQPIGPFHVLIGPNASGKTTFLDVVSFLGRLVSDGVEAAVRERTDNFNDLLWKHQGGHFELAIEAILPENICAALGDENLNAIRYEVAVSALVDLSNEELRIIGERIFLTPKSDMAIPFRSSFPSPVQNRKSLIRPKPSWKNIYSKTQKGYVAFIPEVRTGNKNAAFSYRINHYKSALSQLPPDEFLFPASNWLRNLLSEGIQPFDLNSAAIRRPSPPNQRRGFRTDGSNLPWVVFELQKHPDRFRDWLRHLRTALPDLINIQTILRPEDRHRYLVLEYENGVKVPSWMASDGTLRMLALTLPAYLPDFRGIYLIEEPENGIHPRAVETVFQSLSSVYDAQLLLASHSPVILGCAKAESILCFAKNDDGATDIVTGPNHPRLREWKGDTNLGQLFAAGVLG